ncbi:plasmid mobilization relaxosome protein MobC [Shewanella sp. 202IG2-18]|uniref:plasmid mobilization protein n=1 Tax=Parashewanella hymeniacidonis TaxID=2807618 RepID=UPI00195F597C|nr:plasmid mobilization relaxosome protein MobC [Parashewanella hymeniacidonis]MBM7073263.1 plasmid mobilization relaxosome protein MobC [Parashewanella hymeniacidonis]
MNEHIVKTRLSDTEKINWQGFCQSCGISQSNMLRMMINRVAPIDSANSSFQEVKTNRITIRFTSDNLKKIAYKAKEEGYPNQSNWARANVLASLYREPVLTCEEVNSLRESNRQLAAIGRNLNQIARVLNIEFRESDKITKDMIEMLENKIDHHKQKVNDLLNKNCQRWSITDAPFTA